MMSLVTQRPKHRHPLAATIAGVGALTLLLMLAGIGWCWSGGGRENLAAWVEAVATGLALIAASVAAVFAAGAFSLERDREDQWLDAQRKAQASLIACWWGSKQYDHTVGIGQAAKVIGWTITSGAWVRNASDVPITRVEFDVYMDHELVGSWGHPLPIPPADEPTFLQPPESLSKELHSRAHSAEEPETATNLPDVSVAMRFCDSAGSWWIRTRDGQLMDVTH